MMQNQVQCSMACYFLLTPVLKSGWNVSVFVLLGHIFLFAGLRYTNCEIFQIGDRKLNQNQNNQINHNCLVYRYAVIEQKI